MVNGDFEDLVHASADRGAAHAAVGCEPLGRARYTHLPQPAGPQPRLGDTKAVGRLVRGGASMRCSKCGTESTTSRKFCAACGSPLSRSCPKCGAENAPTSTFCEDCGTALADHAVPAATSSPQAAINGPPNIRVTPEQPDASTALDGERKTVTALFADIKGSTELMEDLDPEEARAIIDPALKLMIDAVHRYDGYVVQSTGDGIFALFGAPVAHEDHPQRACTRALRMQEELKRYSAKVRAEASTPICRSASVSTPARWWCARSRPATAQTEYTPIGHTTNLASRMQTLARDRLDRGQRGRRASFVEGYFILKPLGADQGQRRQRAGQRLRGDRTRTAAHAVAAFGRARADQVRRARARDGGAQARRRAGQGGARADRRGDGGAGGRQVAAVLRVQGDFASRAGWCWRRFRSRTARPALICR